MTVCDQNDGNGGDGEYVIILQPAVHETRHVYTAVSRDTIHHDHIGL